MYLSDVTGFKIDLNKEDIEGIAFDTKHRLVDTAENHWYSHYKCDHLSSMKMKEDEFASFVLWKEKPRYDRLSFLFGLVGMSHVTKSIEDDLREVFKQKQTK